MHKKLVIIVGCLLIAIGAGFAYLLLQDKPADTTGKEEPTAAPNASSPASPASPTPGTYVDYTAEKLAQTSGTKVLFFHAAWCPQCRQLEADIKAGNIPGGVTIFKVDYDSNQKLRQKYGVNLQTTLVRVDDEGNEIKKFVAYDEPTLEALIKNVL